MVDDRQQHLVDKLVNFLVEIGLDVTMVHLQQRTFLPGISVDRGAILIDESRLLYPGDLLHEAGHLAVISHRRENKLDNVSKKASEEMMAIAWSYAALLHLGLEPSVVFHDGGYRGWSESLIENFTQGQYIGVPMLQWIGMTVDEKRAKELGINPYPNMIKWLLE
jgi:hypothetical protein